MPIKKHTQFNEAIFKEPAAPVSKDILNEYDLQNSELKKTMQDMVDTHLQNPKSIGVGLAANQIGYKYQLFLAHITESRAKKHNCEPLPLTFYANANYQPVGDKITHDTEACFSAKSLISDKVPRHQTIQLVAIQLSMTLDKNNKITTIETPQNIETKLHDYTARIFQHEADHGDAKFYFNYLEKGTESCEQHTAENTPSTNEEKTLREKKL